MARERRINTYFSSHTVEDDALWEYLITNHPENIAYWLKYYARLGIMYSSGEKNKLPMTTAITDRSNNTRRKTTGHKKAETVQPIDIPAPEPSDLKTEYNFTGDPLANVSLDISGVANPLHNLEKLADQFIAEEEDEEILKLYQISLNQNKE